MTYHSFEDLRVWKQSCQLSVRVYELLHECRDFSLRDQMQRAGVSIASNIAEGSERGGKDLDRFLRVALGSAAELRTQVYIAEKVGVIAVANRRELVAELKEVSRMIAGLRRSLKTEN